MVLRGYMVLRQNVPSHVRSCFNTSAVLRDRRGMSLRQLAQNTSFSKVEPSMGKNHKQINPKSNSLSSNLLSYDGRRPRGDRVEKKVIFYGCATLGVMLSVYNNTREHQRRLSYTVCGKRCSCCAEKESDMKANGEIAPKGRSI